MEFWFFMLFFTLLTPVLLIVIGYFMWKKCPQEINYMVGYRTSRSMKNEDTWRFAHEHCGRLWWKAGWLILLPTVLVMLPFINRSDNVIGTAGVVVCLVQSMVFVGSVIATENALKRTFYEDGRRR